MRIDILTLFPGMFAGPFDESIVKRAVERGIVTIGIHNIRDHAADRHRTADDYPYGGGAGMVMKPEPVFACAEAVLGWSAGDAARPNPPPAPVILMTPQGRLFHQRIAEELAQEERIVLICGHYEGVDERIRRHLATDELSIGDYVLTGGELAAMVVVDATVRLLPGVVARESTAEESHTAGLLEYPQYTRPTDFRGWTVPDILLSGHHGEVARWRRQQALLRTAERRPELLARADLTPAERRWLAERIERSGDEIPGG